MLFYKMFVVVYVVKSLYVLCSYNLYHTLLSLRHTAGCMELYMYVCVNVWIYAYLYVNLYVYVCMYVCICVCEYMHIFMYVCMYICICVCVFVYVCRVQQLSEFF